MRWTVRIESLSPRSASDQYFMGRLVIVDVRGRSDYARERVPRSMHVPLRRLRRQLEELDSDRPIAFLCRSGHRSAWVARGAARRRDGVAHIAGGMNAWLAAGLPAARCSAPPPNPRTG